jgi:hypothetical protein
MEEPDIQKRDWQNEIYKQCDKEDRELLNNENGLTRPSSEHQLEQRVRRRAKYHCHLSPDPDLLCEYGGNKTYNYGFVSGTASYCRHRAEERFVSEIKICPKTKEQGRESA